MAKTVAIVEDDPAIRANYADMLKKHGYQVSAFADRSSALAAFRPFGSTGNDRRNFKTFQPEGLQAPACEDTRATSLLTRRLD